MKQAVIRLRINNVKLKLRNCDKWWFEIVRVTKIQEKIQNNANFGWVDHLYPHKTGDCVYL